MASYAETNLSDAIPPLSACAPCGPECRFAQELRHWPNFVWCTTRGAPHSTCSPVDCRQFSPRMSTADTDTSPTIETPRPGL